MARKSKRSKHFRARKRFTGKRIVRPWPTVLRSEGQLVLDVLGGRVVIAAPAAVLCLYCGAVATPHCLRRATHRPTGCVIRSDEDNIGTVIELGLRALLETQMIHNDTLETEIKATDTSGGALVFRVAYGADTSTQRGRSDAISGGTTLRCAVAINGQEVTLDARVFEGWARHALNTLDSDY